MTTIEKQVQDGIADVLTEVTQEWELFDHGPLQSHYVEELQEHHAGLFALERDPQGDPWAELAPSTIAKKGHDFILTEFDDLHQSLVAQTGDSIRRKTAERGGSELIYGTSDFKSGWHMTGTENMPKREHVGLDEFFVKGIVGDSADFLIEALKG